MVFSLLRIVSESWEGKPCRLHHEKPRKKMVEVGFKSLYLTPWGEPQGDGKATICQYRFQVQTAL